MVSIREVNPLLWNKRLITGIIVYIAMGRAGELKSQKAMKDQKKVISQPC